LTHHSYLLEKAAIYADTIYQNWVKQQKLKSPVEGKGGDTSALPLLLGIFNDNRNNMIQVESTTVEKKKSTSKSIIAATGILIYVIITMLSAYYCVLFVFVCNLF
jgi:hypothetical protein